VQTGWLGSTPGPLRPREIPANRIVIPKSDEFGPGVRVELISPGQSLGKGFYDRADHRARLARLAE
jgi:hypothetical protein